MNWFIISLLCCASNWCGEQASMDQIPLSFANMVISINDNNMDKVICILFGWKAKLQGCSFMQCADTLSSNKCFGLIWFPGRFSYDKIPYRGHALDQTPIMTGGNLSVPGGGFNPRGGKIYV